VFTRWGLAATGKKNTDCFRKNFEQLTREREDAPPKPGSPHHAPLATIAPAPKAGLARTGSARPGQDFVVTAQVDSPYGVKSVRLRYRHMTQTEDYQTAEMSLDGSSGRYKGHIPGSFIDKKWDLMYFVETIGNSGGGRMYPDLETEQPYVIVSVDAGRIAISQNRTMPRDYRVRLDENESLGPSAHGPIPVSKHSSKANQLLIQPS
jgi:hypothetical protein